MAITVTLNNNEYTVSQTDLNFEAILTGTASDTAEPNRVPDNFTYSWSVVDKPVGSNFALPNNGRTVSGFMDVWGTVRVFCIATNPATGLSSETDPLLAPNEAFCDIKVRHSPTLLQKPAKSQRNWHDEYYALVDYVANLDTAADVNNAFGFSTADPTTRTSGIVELAASQDIAKANDYDGVTYTQAQMDAGQGPFYALIPSQLITAIKDADSLGIPGIDVNGENLMAKAVEDRALVMLQRQDADILDDIQYTRQINDGDRLRWDNANSYWRPYDHRRFDTGIILNSADEAFTPTQNTGDVGEILWTKLDNTYARMGYDIEENEIQVADIIAFTPQSNKGIDLGAENRRWNDLYLSGESIDMENGVISIASGGVMSITASSVAKEVPSILGTKVTNGFVKWDGTNFVTETISAANGDITEVVAGLGLTGGGTAGTVTLNVSNLDTSHLNASALLTSGESFVDNDASLMSAAAINDLIESKGYVTSAGDITSVVAGTGLTGGGTTGDVTLNVSGLTLTQFANSSVLLSSETFADTDDQLMTAAAIADYVAANGGSGSSSSGSADDIQLADGSGGFTAANWNISSNHLLPEVTGTYDVGSSNKRVRKLWAEDASFGDDVSVGDALTVSGQIILQDFSSLNDNGSAGTLKFLAGDNGASLSGNILLNTDEVQVQATTASSEPKLALVDSSGDKLILTTQSKQGADHTIELPSGAGASGDVMVITSTSTGVSTVEFESPVEKIIYSTHVTREVAGEASFTGGSMNSFADASQACIYWVKNTTGNPITLNATHVFCGEMKNVSLGFSLCKAASDSAAIANTWTQVGTSFTLTNSSGSDNVLGQAASTRTTSTTINNGEYIGLCVTDIPQSNRNDKRIVITFECSQTTYFS